MKSHKGHIFESVDTVMEREVAALKEILEYSEGVTDEYNTHIESARLFQEKMNAKQASSRKVIEDTFTELIDLM